MKLTLKQLKTIINESLNEDFEGTVPSQGFMDLTKMIHSAVELADELAKTDKRFAKCTEHLLAAFNCAKGGVKR